MNNPNNHPRYTHRGNTKFTNIQQVKALGYCVERLLDEDVRGHLFILLSRYRGDLSDLQVLDYLREAEEDDKWDGIKIEEVRGV